MDMKKLINRYRHDPVLFVEEVLKAKPEPEQRQMLTALNENRMIAIKAGHGVGKTTTLAWSILWFLFTRPYPKIPCTAPTMHQLRDILWAEISKWLSRSPVLQQFFEWTVERVALKGQEEKWFAVARTATKPDAMQGFHSESLLFVLDEASGINDAIFEPILGALTGDDTKIIIVGNPTRLIGFFHDAFTRNRAQFKCITLNAENSSRVSQEYIDSIISLYGKDSDPYRVRVLGEFPKAQADTYIPLDLVERAIAGYDEHDAVADEEVKELHVGVDVARFGDDESVIWITKQYKAGFYVSKIHKIIHHNTTVELTGETKALIRILNKRFENKCVNVNVDETGVGAGVVDELDADHGDLNYYVIPQTFGGTGGTLNEEPIEYSNNTGLIWGNIKRLLMANKLFIEDDAETIMQLTNRKYTVNEDGKIKLERKQDIKKRDACSPDRADALGLSLATNIAHFSGMLNY